MIAVDHSRPVKHSKHCRDGASKWLAVALLALALAPFAGCKSTGGVTGAGAPSGLNTMRGPATRAFGRTTDKAMQVNPGYERYLVRLAERRAARGLREPVELRIARRRERYKSVFDVMKSAAVAIDEAVVNPITRRIPWVAREQDPTLSGATDTVEDNVKGVIDPTSKMLNGIFKPLGTHRGKKSFK